MDWYVFFEHDRFSFFCCFCITIWIKNIAAIKSNRNRNGYKEDAHEHCDLFRSNALVNLFVWNGVVYLHVFFLQYPLMFQSYFYGKHMQILTSFLWEFQYIIQPFISLLLANFYLIQFRTFVCSFAGSSDCLFVRSFLNLFIRFEFFLLSLDFHTFVTYTPNV